MDIDSDEYAMGPFTGNEIDDLVSALELNGLEFHIMRDKQVENSKMKQDSSAILRTELRTDIFLDQSYYVVCYLHDKENVETILRPILGAEISHEVPENVHHLESEYEDQLWREQILEKQKKRKWFLRILILPMIFLFLYFYVTRNLM